MYFSVQLLVNNKIISLDLPVAEVYKKVWCTTNEVCVCSLAWWFYFSDVCRLVPGGALFSHHIPSWWQHPLFVVVRRKPVILSSF